jgi:hypothetical protein
MRTVKVDLDADVNGLLIGIKEADKATTKLDHDIEALDRDINKLPADAAKAGAALSTLGAAAKETGTDVDDLGKKTESAGKKTQTGADDAGKLRTRIDELQGSVKKLASEFDRTGDPALLKKFRADSNELAGLKRMAKGLEDVAVDVEKVGVQAEKAGASLGSLFQGGLTSPAGIGAIAALSVPALAGAGGLVGVGAGAGVAGAGLAGAVAGDPLAFQAAWATAIGGIKKEWIDASQPFVGPTMAAIHSIGPMVASWHIDTMFAKAATFVTPLVHGVEGFASGVERGVAALVDHAGPEIAVMAADLPKIGDSIGKAMSMISSQSKGGAEGLHALAVAVESLVVGTGAVVAGAEAMASGITDASNAAKGFFDHVPGWVQVALPPLALYRAAFDAFTPDTLKAAETGKSFGHALDGVALSGAIAAEQAKVTENEFAALSTKLSETKVTADSLAGSMTDKLVNSMLSSDHATLGFQESLTRLSQSFKDNGKQLDITKEKGQANREAVLAAVEANLRNYDSVLALTGSQQDATAAYNSGTASIEKQLHQVGLNQTAIDGLIGKYRNVPDKVNTRIAIEGLTAAINDLDDVMREINHLPARKDIQVLIHTGVVGGKEAGLLYSGGGGSTSGSSSSSKNHPKFNALGAIRHAATGLIVGPSDPGTLIGEPQTGGEALIPLRGISQMRAMSLTSVIADSYGFGITPWAGAQHGNAVPAAVAVAVTVVAAPGSDSAVGTLVNKLIRDGLVVVKASQIRAA